MIKKKNLTSIILVYLGIFYKIMNVFEFFTLFVVVIKEKMVHKSV